ncbi:PDZ domain-containing protein [Microvirga sp. 2TAF3]|uniref:PDZ domain-containing protein n=1 Tax=Microvirga sp. 2TAF3 TaxID=3233014 RepID=UPI003F9985EA
MCVFKIPPRQSRRRWDFKIIKALSSLRWSRGPAEKAGIKAGDVITRFNGKAVEGARDPTRSVAAAKPGTSVSLTVFRGNHTQELTAVIGSRSQDQAKQGDGAPGRSRAKD